MTLTPPWMACYFMQIPYVQSGTSIKTQSMETKPMERELEMMKMELQHPGRNFRPPGPELPARCLPDAPRCHPAPREMEPAGTSAPRDRNFRPPGTSAQVPPKFRN